MPKSLISFPHVPNAEISGGCKTSAGLPCWAIFFIKHLPQLGKFLTAEMLQKTFSNITALENNHTNARLQAYGRLID
jgi:hypothetical protein